MKSRIVTTTIRHKSQFECELEGDRVCKEPAGQQRLIGFRVDRDRERPFKILSFKSINDLDEGAIINLPNCLTMKTKYM